MTSDWTKEKVLRALVDFSKANRRLPTMNDLENNKSLPSYLTVYQFLTAHWAIYVKKQLKAEDAEGNEFEYNRSLWNAQNVQEVLDDFVAFYQRWPKSWEFGKKVQIGKTMRKLPYRSQVVKWLGPDWYSRYNIEQPFACETWEDVKRAISAFQEKYGHFPRATDFTRKNGLPTYNWMKKHFGPEWNPKLKQEFNVPLASRQLEDKTVSAQYYDWESVIKAVRLFQKKNGRFPRTGDFKLKEGLPTNAFMKKVYGRDWNVRLKNEFHIPLSNAQKNRY